MGRGSRQTGRRASPSGRAGARERQRARSRWDAIRRLLGSGEDPYAGADIRISRNAVAVLSAVHGALVLLLLPLSPPNEALGDIAGWAIALVGVGLNFGAALWLLNERRQVSFDSLLVLTYVGAGQLLVMQLLAEAVLPYQLLMLVWVAAAGSSRPGAPWCCWPSSWQPCSCLSPSAAAPRSRETSSAGRSSSRRSGWC